MSRSLEIAHSTNSLKRMWPPWFVSIMLNSAKELQRYPSRKLRTNYGIRQNSARTVVPVVYFSNPLLNDGLYLFWSEFILGNASVIVGVDPTCLRLFEGRQNYDSYFKCSRVESLEVLEILPQGFQEQSELLELKIVATMLVAHSGEGLVPRKVVCPVDGRLAVEEFVALQNVPYSFVHLKGNQYQL